VVDDAAGAGGLAAAAIETKVQVLAYDIAGLDLSLCQSQHELNPAARRVGFVAGLYVSGARGEAQAAMNAGEPTLICAGIHRHRGIGWCGLGIFNDRKSGQRICQGKGCRVPSGSKAALRRSIICRSPSFVETSIKRQPEEVFFQNEAAPPLDSARLRMFGIYVGGTSDPRTAPKAASATDAMPGNRSMK